MAPDDSQQPSMLNTYAIESPDIYVYYVYIKKKRQAVVMKQNEDVFSSEQMLSLLVWRKSQLPFLSLVSWSGSTLAAHESFHNCSRRLHRSRKETSNTEPRSTDTKTDVFIHS